jgi:hypothetical protein
MFPPGCAKLGTIPVSTGSAAMMAMGMFPVACFAASAGNVERHDQIYLEPDQFSRKLWKPIKLCFRGAEFKCNILPVHVAKVAQSLPEFTHERLAVRDPYVEGAYSSDLRLLGSRDARPRDRSSAEQRNELTALRASSASRGPP